MRLSGHQSGYALEHRGEAIEIGHLDPKVGKFNRHARLQSELW